VRRFSDPRVACPQPIQPPLSAYTVSPSAHQPPGAGIELSLRAPRPHDFRPHSAKYPPSYTDTSKEPDLNSM